MSRAGFGKGDRSRLIDGEATLAHFRQAWTISAKTRPHASFSEAWFQETVSRCSADPKQQEGRDREWPRAIVRFPDAVQPQRHATVTVKINDCPGPVAPFRKRPWQSSSGPWPCGSNGTEGLARTPKNATRPENPSRGRQRKSERPSSGPNREYRREVQPRQNSGSPWPPVAANS